MIAVLLFPKITLGCIPGTELLFRMCTLWECQVLLRRRFHFIRLGLQGFEKDQVSTERFLNLRYDGTDVAVMTTCSTSSSYEESFEDTYKREFGFVLEDRNIQVGLLISPIL